MRTLIIDDELAARERLKQLLRSYEFLDCVGEASDGLDALATVHDTRPDLLLLDIQMPGMSGFELLQQIAEASRPLVIFTTGYDEYALAAFDRYALAYLLKPVDAEKLAVALTRAHALWASSVERADEVRRIDQSLSSMALPPMLVGRRQARFYLLRPSKILWISMEGGIAKAYTQDDSYWLTQTLQELEVLLASLHFFRARRDLLVNLAGVHSIKRCDRSSFLLVMNHTRHMELAVSERQAKHLRQILPGL